MYLRILISFLIIHNIFFAKHLKAQQFGQLYYNFINPMMMDAEAYSGISLGLNVNYKKFAYEFEYSGKIRKTENRYHCFNPQFKILLSAKEKNSRVDVYNYLTVGYYGFKVFKPSTFNGRAENLTAPYWDSLESARVYNEYKLGGWNKTHAIQIGFENVKEKHLTGVSPAVYYAMNPLGWIVKVLDYSKGVDYKLDFTRTFRFSLFAAAPGWLNFEEKVIEPSGGSYLSPYYPQQKVVLEPSMKNLIGFRLSLIWKTLKPFGFTFGLEGTMVPGIYNVPGVYGRNFPDDNIFLKAHLGIALAYSKKRG